MNNLQNRLNAYRIMWVFVFFDLPTETPQDRKNYARFRKSLQEDGFAMMQFSVYARHCNSRENSEVHIGRVKKLLPAKGNIMLLSITDKQFGMIEFFLGKEEAPKPDTPQQLELF
jgi:CRISPR-associated protein Cas2